MNKIKYILSAVLIGISLFFCSWYVLNGDVDFGSDIARDFLLFREIDAKQFILIGPKSSVEGLFHGPLWLYLNYPAYLLGGGNPVIVGWFWVSLIGEFLIPFFYIAKKLFNEASAILFVLMTVLYMSFHANSFTNPVGTMFLIPINFYIFIRYLQTLKFKYLILYIFILGLLIQFEMAIGIPFTILSFIYLFAKTYKEKKLKHMFSFLVILIPLSTFIFFDLRHDFIMFKALLRYISPESGNSIKYSPINLLIDRFSLMTTQVEFLRFNPNFRNLIVGAIFIFFLGLGLKDKKYKQIYFTFLYFYAGFFILTFINRGPILYFYFYPLFPLVFLIFSSFVTSRYKNLFLILFFVIYLLNFQNALNDINSSKNTISKIENSWKFLKNLSDKTFSGDEKELGYFIYTPDIIGYGPKYAFLYNQKNYKDKNISYFQKKNTTYIIVATPAKNNPYLSYTWWKENKVKITKKPQSSVTLENGWVIEKYELTDEEVKVPHDSGIDPGLGFR